MSRQASQSAAPAAGDDPAVQTEAPANPSRRPANETANAGRAHQFAQHTREEDAKLATIGKAKAQGTKWSDNLDTAEEITKAPAPTKKAPTVTQRAKRPRAHKHRQPTGQTLRFVDWKPGSDEEPGGVSRRNHRGCGSDNSKTV